MLAWSVFGDIIVLEITFGGVFMRCSKKGCCCDEITGLAHIGVFVQDIEKSKDFYTNVLCFECYFETGIDTDDGVVKVAFIRTGNCVIELVEQPTHEKRSADGVIAHIALDVKDIDIVQACLEKDGLEFETDKPVHLATIFDNGVKYINLKGPDGEVIELNETL